MGAMMSTADQRHAASARLTEALRRATPAAADAMANARQNAPLIGITAAEATARLKTWATSLRQASTD